MTACDLERRTDGHPVCFTHKRSVQECLAAKDSEIDKLRKQLRESEGRYHAILLTLESRDMSLWDMEQERDAALEQVKEISVANDILARLKAEMGAIQRPRWMSASVGQALNYWPEYRADARRALKKVGP
jgi:hypothetical protein